MKSFDELKKEYDSTKKQLADYQKMKRKDFERDLMSDPVVVDGNATIKMLEIQMQYVCQHFFELSGIYPDGSESYTCIKCGKVEFL